MPITNAARMYTGTTMKLTHHSSAVKTVGSGMPTAASAAATIAPTRFATTIEVVSNVWIRTRCAKPLSSAEPSRIDP